MGRLSSSFLTGLLLLASFWSSCTALGSVRARAAWQRAELAGASCSGHEDSAGANLLDVLGRFREREREGVAVAPQAVAVAPQAAVGRRVAMCMFGHVRSFVLPGVYSGIAKNVMATAEGLGGKVDLFFMGHRGDYGHTASLFGEEAKKGGGGGNGNVGSSSSSSSSSAEGDAALEEALASPGLNVKFTEIHNSSNRWELERLWKQEGFTNHCVGIQFLWMDRCVRKVMESETPYDLIIMTRPDVGVFAPLPWSNISKTRVNFIKRHTGAGEDWFFTMPTSVVDEYWGEVRELYTEKSYYAPTKKTRSPDLVMFPPDKNKEESAGKLRSLLEPLQFPAVIVRNATTADCVRSVPDVQMKQMCDNLTAAGYWAELHS